LEVLDDGIEEFQPQNDSSYQSWEEVPPWPSWEVRRGLLAGHQFLVKPAIGPGKPEGGIAGSEREEAGNKKDKR
jgi:hypothetical protein